MRKCFLLAFFNLLFVIWHPPLGAQSWQQQPDFPGLERDDACAVTVGNKAYYGLGFAVGFTCMNDWWSFDSENGWQQKTSFPGLPRQYAAATSLGKYIYVFGGIDQNVISLNDFWRYDTETDSWEELDTLPSIGRQAPMMISFQDKILLGLGRNNITYFNDVWQYDPSAKTFETISSIPGAGRYYPVFANVAGNPLIVHGWNLNECFDECIYYSPADDEWNLFDHSPHSGCNYVSAASHNYSLFLGGGLNENNDYLNTFFEYNIRSNQWTPLPDLPSVPRKGSSMFVLDGILYLAGGIDSNYTRLKEIWSFDFIEIEPSELEISPNPANTWLHLYLDESMRGFCEDIVFVSIYQISGQIVLREELTAFNPGLWFPVNISHLNPGMYIVNIENCEGIESKKVVVE